MHYTRRATLGLLLGSLGMVRVVSGGMARFASGETLSMSASLVLLCQFTRLTPYRMYTPCMVLYEAKDFCRIHTRFILSSTCQNPNLTK